MLPLLSLDPLKDNEEWVVVGEQRWFSAPEDLVGLIPKAWEPS